MGESLALTIGSFESMRLYKCLVSHAMSLGSCFKKKESEIFSVYNNNGQTKKSVLNHIVQSNNVLNSPEIEKLANDKTPVIVFGAGNYTLRLLETTALGKCNIVAFVDNDSKKHGNIINGKDFLFKNDALILFHVIKINQFK